MNITSKQDRVYLHQHMGVLPEYVQRFLRHSERRLSASTLREYSLDYEIFFDWLNGYMDNKWRRIKDVPLSTLESLRVDDIEEGFLYYLSLDMKNSDKKRNNQSTINRKISSLKSLFNYLSDVAEDDDFNPLLNRNVMAKIELDEIRTDITTQAENIRNKILIGNEIEEYRAFIASGYVHTVNNRLAIRRYRENKERDTAIVSLILSSGLRIDEVANIQIDDLNLKNENIYVLTKGQKFRTISFSSIAASDLKEYLSIRKDRYNVGNEVKALFLTLQQTKTGRPMTKRAMQLMIEKYSKAFGKPMLKAHDLRHSFATRFYQRTKNIAQLSRILGHESLDTTMIYTHVFDDEIKEAIEKVDRYEDDIMG